MDVRKYVDLIEEIWMENDKLLNPPARKAAAIAVISNPFVDTYEEISIHDGLR